MRTTRAEREMEQLLQLAGLRDDLRKVAAERDQWRELLVSLDKDALCDAHLGIGAEEYLAAWLAARDAKQRREGAAEVWDQIAKIGRSVTDQFIHLTAAYAEEQAQRLREGGE